MSTGQRIAALGMAVSGTLAVVKVVTGLAGHSTAVVADGLESGGDVFSSGFVLLGLTLAARPPDEDHPYGHGRIEILTGLLIGLILTAGGALISYGAIERVGRPREALAAYVVWPLAASLVARACMALTKFHFGRKLKSSALTADAWHETTDAVSAIVALIAVGLTLTDPVRFLNADRFGGFVVGLIVISAGVRVAYETAMQLIDTMPAPALMKEIRSAALAEAGVRGVEKCFARKTGMRYHVDLHLEVDPEMTVRQSHEIAHRVQQRVLTTLDWVAGVLVHVEPAP
ncbi:MAG TPA: cation diffusion facilitator family transporter [Bryobacteraceae bacterium]|nr:cation diffusion facilitator family transporter [Bryobacteraceae bacterium]